jgi:hypothetical protein
MNCASAAENVELLGDIFEWLAVHGQHARTCDTRTWDQSVDLACPPCTCGLNELNGRICHVVGNALRGGL